MLTNLNFSSICGRRFAKSSNLKTHEKIHDKLGNTKMTLSLSECPKCSKKWERLGKSLETHILNCSGVLDKKGSYRYQCFVCQKNFQTRSATADHLALLHNYHISNVKNFCFICKEEFEDILTHARNHNCPFQCEIVSCGKLDFSTLYWHVCTSSASSILKLKKNSKITSETSIKMDRIDPFLVKFAQPHSDQKIICALIKH